MKREGKRGERETMGIWDLLWQNFMVIGVAINCLLLFNYLILGNSNALSL
jgi:hypothetical protein